MVEVFKTNVQEAHESDMVIQTLLVHFPANRINFDLEDCDKILRVEGGMVQKEKIIALLNSCGYQCQVLG
jgi:hypothetical protein